MNKRLVIITGSNRGLGKALVDTFLMDGSQDTVVGISRSYVEQSSPRYVDVGADLSSIEGCESVLLMLGQLIGQGAFEQVILFNNAGRLGEVVPSFQASPYDIAQTIFVNQTAPMILQNGLLSIGSSQNVAVEIVNLLSGAALKAYDGWGAYCSSKAGLLMATQVLSTEINLHQLPAKVWGFAPGVVDTEMQTTLRTLDSSQFSQVERFQRLFAEGQLRSPASVATFLYQAVGNPQFENGGFYDIRSF
ncbi:MAG TPA: hypothetical protein DCR35_13810 [Runella sp.]|nr:hypothetical protein [Runella sp.]HAO50268.1 hypothetical protein [Runella sp.]